MKRRNKESYLNEIFTILQKQAEQASEKGIPDKGLTQHEIREKLKQGSLEYVNDAVNQLVKIGSVAPPAQYRARVYPVGEIEYLDPGSSLSLHIGVRSGPWKVTARGKREFVGYPKRK